MLGEMDATAIIAVNDVQRATDFYRDTLGLKPDEQEQDGMAGFRSGSVAVLLYESEFAGTNRANALAWSVEEDFDRVFGELRDHGVTFEHYDDLPGLTLEGDVHVAEGFKGIWFKDPDGNILHVNGR